MTRYDLLEEAYKFLQEARGKKPFGSRMVDWHTRLEKKYPGISQAGAGTAMATLGALSYLDDRGRKPGLVKNLGHVATGLAGLGAVTHYGRARQQYLAAKRKRKKVRGRR